MLQPAMNLQIAQVYLQHGDPAMSRRTWQHVMEQMISTKTGNPRERWEYAIKDEVFDLLRHRKLIETSSEHFFDVLNKGTVSTNVYLRRAHNYAIGMHYSVASAAKTSLAAIKIQRETGHHFCGTSGNH